MESYNAQTDDGPICNTLVDASAKDQFGLLVYSKLRSVEESSSVSVNNVKVAAYEDGYQGIGGYGYCHYLFVTDNSPLPWTACAFIAYMTCTADGFSAWGKDMGGYSSNPDGCRAETEEQLPPLHRRHGRGRHHCENSQPRTTAATNGGPPTASSCSRIRNTVQTLRSPSAAGSRC